MVTSGPNAMPSDPPMPSSRPLPARAQRSVDALWAQVRKELDQQLPQILHETELALTRDPLQGDPRQAAAQAASVRALALGAQRFCDAFIAPLQSGLAALRPPEPVPGASATQEPVQELRLLDDEEDSDDATLENLGRRAESRNGLALQLLGHRLAVLAGAPAFDAERLPVGPQAMAAALRVGSDALSMTRMSRLMLFQQFEKALAVFYPDLLDALNARLVADGILPHLSFVPMRVRPGSAAPTIEEIEGIQTVERVPSARTSEPDEQAAFGELPAGLGNAPPPPAFEALQALLGRRRQLLSKLRAGEPERNRESLATGEVLQALERMRTQAVQATSLPEFRQILLAQARQAHGHGVALADTDQDSLELLGLLMGQSQRDIRKSSVGEALLQRLTLPLAQLVLRDVSFFTDTAHPARRLLSAVSAAGAPWLAEDDQDAQWLGLLQRAVAAVQHDPAAGSDTFHDAWKTLETGLDALERKADMTARRQVEAARGREKLALARRHAVATLKRLLENSSPPRFQQLLLEQTWTDVLALSWLRSGPESGAWQELLHTSQRLVEACSTGAGQAFDGALLRQAQEALEMIGYHAVDAAAIARHLAGPHSVDGDAASRTELLMQVRARARLGGNGSDEGVDPFAAEPALDQAAESALEALASHEMPSWIELEGDDGRWLRRRLAWAGPGSRQALLVNRRGQRVEGPGLEGLARLLVDGRLRLLGDDDPTPLDRAWDGVLASLRQVLPEQPSHAGGSGPEASDGH